MYWEDGDGVNRCPDGCPQGPQVTVLGPNIQDTSRSGGWAVGDWVHGDVGVNMNPLLDELAPKLEGKAEVIRLDTDVFPLEAKRWQLRVIPTQVFFNAEGEEVDRHESYLPADELLAKLRAAGAKLD